MSKSIYEEAITATNILCANDFDNPPNNPSLNATEILDNFNIINEALEQAQKQENLLELYRQLVLDLGLVIEYDTTDDWNGPVDYEYLEINDNGLEALKTYKKIKEKENDKRTKG